MVVGRVKKGGEGGGAEEGYEMVQENIGPYRVLQIMSMANETATRKVLRCI